jgi:hypothetical protein
MFPMRFSCKMAVPNKSLTSGRPAFAPELGARKNITVVDEGNEFQSSPWSVRLARDKLHFIFQQRVLVTSFVGQSLTAFLGIGG